MTEETFEVTIGSRVQIQAAPVWTFVAPSSPHPKVDARRFQSWPVLHYTPTMGGLAEGTVTVFLDKVQPVMVGLKSDDDWEYFIKLDDIVMLLPLREGVS